MSLKIVKLIRPNFFDQDLYSGAKGFLREMKDLGTQPLPWLRTNQRILSRNELTHRRTGKYPAKGALYPDLPSVRPNQAHQGDLAGPCHPAGPQRIYDLNVADMATVRCGLPPSDPKVDRISSMVPGKHESA